MPRDELIEQLTLHLAQTDAILVSGPRQSGKSHALRALSSRLKAAGTPHTVVAHDDPQVLSLINAALPGDILLFGNLELTSARVLRALADQIATGVKVVGTLNTDVDAHAYEEVMLDLAAAAHPAANALAQTQNLRLNPLTQEQAERLAHTKQLTPLNSVTISAVASLSWGRPGWLLDLLKLAAAGKVQADPLPQITGINSSDLHLPSLSFASRVAEESLEQADIAAALVLASVEPRSIDGASYLIGNERVSTLRKAALLVSASSHSGTYGVPELYAAAMLPQLDPAVMRSTAATAANVLLMQEGIGIPLSVRESMFCAWAFDSAVLAESPSELSHQSNVQLHSQLSTQLASMLLLFGRSESRDLMLRAGGAPAFSDIDRVRSTTLFRGPIEGLRTYRSLVSPSDTPAATIGNSVSPERKIALDFLKQQLIAQSDGSHTQTGPLTLLIDRSPGEPPSPVDSASTQANLVFARLNDSLPLDEDTLAIIETARTHPMPEVAILAEQLYALDQLSFGVQPSPHFNQPGSAGRIAGAQHSPSRFQRIAALAVSDNGELHDLLATSAIAEALLCLLTAENNSAAQGLQHTVARLPGAMLHALWAQHFCAAITALATGNAARAALEWESLAQTLPYFLPQRIRARIAEIGEELSLKASGKRSERRHLLLDYVLGDLDSISLPTLDPSRKPEGAPPSRPLPIFRLISAHLAAREAQNPVALQRIGIALQHQHLWAPAAYAFLDARAIFLRRRATGSVTQCSVLIEELDKQVKLHAPWFSTESLVPPQAVRLTRRETSVTRLCIEGLSNRQIAEQLGLSIRTVESHLSAARAKLGATRRTQLAERFSDLDKLASA